MVRSEAIDNRLRTLGRRSTTLDETIQGFPSAPLGPGWRAATADIIASGEAAIQRRRSIRNFRRTTLNNNHNYHHNNNNCNDCCSDNGFEKLPLHVVDSTNGVVIDGEGPLYPDIRIKLVWSSIVKLYITYTPFYHYY